MTNDSKNEEFADSPLTRRKVLALAGVTGITLIQTQTMARAQQAQPVEAEHLARAVMGLDEAVAVEQDVAARFDDPLDLLIADAGQQAERHPCRAQFADVAWDDVWFGAVATSVLFTLGKQVIGLYLGRTGVGSAYGAAQFYGSKVTQATAAA